MADGFSFRFWAGPGYFSTVELEQEVDFDLSETSISPRSQINLGGLVPQPYLSEATISGSFIPNSG